MKLEAGNRSLSIPLDVDRLMAVVQVLVDYLAPVL
jgi:hypothetical protein